MTVQPTREAAVDPAELARNLIQRINVGDSLTRSAASTGKIQKNVVRSEHENHYGG